MNVSIFLTSFRSRYFSASNPRTSPPIRAENAEASNLVIGPMPLRPASSACQVDGPSNPKGDTTPIPVTTTRRFMSASRLRVRPDVLDDLLDGRQLLGVLVRDLERELLLERHDQLDDVERVRAEVVHEMSLGLDLRLVDPELLHDDVLDLFLDGRHRLLPPSRNRGRAPVGSSGRGTSYIDIPPFTSSVTPVT